MSNNAKEKKNQITEAQKAAAAKDFAKAGELETIKTENIFTKHADMTLAKLAKATGLNHATIMSYAKKPVEGQIYNPNAVNYAEVDKFIEKKKVDMSKIDWTEAAKAEVSAAATTGKVIETSVGDIFRLKYDGKTYGIIYKTDTHVVILEVGSTEPRVMKHTTFAACRPVKTSLEELKAEAEKLKVEAE